MGSGGPGFGMRRSRFGSISSRYLRRSGMRSASWSLIGVSITQYGKQGLKMHGPL